MLALLSLASLCLPTSARAQEATVSMYGSFEGRDRHMMPRIGVRTPTGLAVRAEAAYLVDVWSRATLDVRNRAALQTSRTLHEITAKLGVDTGDLRATASYRYVTLPDYSSHTIALPLAYASTQWGTGFALDPYVRWNQIRQLGNPNFDRSSFMAGARLGFSPWLGGLTFGRVSYELQRASGYLASPYNYVGVGGSGPFCVGASLCIPERLPDERLQHAFVLQLRRALTETLSIGLSYRFFVDDWSMTSHTLEPDVALSAWRGGLLRLRYRGYVQSDTEAYRAAQGSVGLSPLPAPAVASDPRWAALQTHRISFDLEQAFRWPEDTLGWTVVVSLGFYRISHADALYDPSNALEGTAALALTL